MSSRAGRPPRTSRADLEHVALRLFADRGFACTTVEDVAAAAGISRRTFFRYYRSKNDVVWGDFDAELTRLHRFLAGVPADRPLADTLRDALVLFNHVEGTEATWHRQRMHLILEVPALQAHSTLRYADWRAVIEQFAAHRLGVPTESLGPRTIGHVLLGVALAAYEQWLDDDSADLDGLLVQAMNAVITVSA